MFYIKHTKTNKTTQIRMVKTVPHNTCSRLSAIVLARRRRGIPPTLRLIDGAGRCLSLGGLKVSDVLLIDPSLADGEVQRDRRLERFLSL